MWRPLEFHDVCPCGEARVIARPAVLCCRCWKTLHCCRSFNVITRTVIIWCHCICTGFWSTQIAFYQASWHQHHGLHSLIANCMGLIDPRATVTLWRVPWSCDLGFGLWGAADALAMPPSVVNDDFCDCADGSDEPGTDACAGQSETLFYCVGTQLNVTWSLQPNSWGW